MRAELREAWAAHDKEAADRLQAKVHRIEKKRKAERAGAVEGTHRLRSLPLLLTTRLLRRGNQPAAPGVSLCAGRHDPRIVLVMAVSTDEREPPE